MGLRLHFRRGKPLPMNPYRIWLRPFLFATILLLAGTAALTPFRGKAAILGMVAVRWASPPG